MKEEDFNIFAGKYLETSGYKKFANYIREVFESDYVKNFVNKIRKEYKIPKNGFVPNKDGSRNFPPKKWVYEDNSEKSSKIYNEIVKVCNKYKINSLGGASLFDDYIFYNIKDCRIDIESPDNVGVCLVMDVPDIKKHYDELKEFEDEDNLIYPVSLRISPYASLRDIVNYINTVYSHSILPLQNKYKDKNIKLGKFKKRKKLIQNRNNFIYENRHLSRREILSLVGDKFGADGVIDYAYIGKIISLEKKRRKEV